MSYQQRGQLKVLTRVKELKEEQAFRTVNIKRLELEKALKAAQKAQEEVEKSRSTLERREDAVYEEILDTIVPLDEMDIRKGMVLTILKEHENLEDEKTRAEHVHARTENELDEARVYHRKTIRDKDKYYTLVDEMTKDLEKAADLKEENEVDDLFIANMLLAKRKEAL